MDARSQRKSALAAVQAERQALERMARVDLRPTPPGFKASGAHLPACSFCDPSGPEHFEPRTIHWLERQRGLKVRLRPADEVTGCFQFAFPFEAGPIAL